MPDMTRVYVRMTLGCRCSVWAMYGDDEEDCDTDDELLTDCEYGDEDDDDV